MSRRFAEVTRYYNHQGIWLESENRVVLTSEGPAFMRALLKQSGKRYYRFVDESAKGERGTGTRRATWGSRRASR